MARKSRGIEVTYAVAMAAGRDAGDVSMRKAGRSVWSRRDFSAAQRTFKKLMGIA